jgi:hypothetical protein
MLLYITGIYVIIYNGYICYYTQTNKSPYLFLVIIFYHSFDHINNFIIICDRIKINCHHSFIRNPMMCVNPLNAKTLIVYNVTLPYIPERNDKTSAFIDQRLPNLVQHLFADVIYDAIWLMNIHEQKYLWFLAMRDDINRKFKMEKLKWSLLL